MITKTTTTTTTATRTRINEDVKCTCTHDIRACTHAIRATDQDVPSRYNMCLRKTHTYKYITNNYKRHSKKVK